MVGFVHQGVAVDQVADPAPVRDNSWAAAVLLLVDRPHARERGHPLAVRQPGAEVRAMHDDSVLVAIEAALSSSALCVCGANLTVTTHDDAAWLECASRARTSRLPRPIAGLLRDMFHERTFVVALPAGTGVWGLQVRERMGTGGALLNA